MPSEWAIAEAMKLMDTYAVTPAGEHALAPMIAEAFDAALTKGWHSGMRGASAIVAGCARGADAAGKASDAEVARGIAGLLKEIGDAC